MGSTENQCISRSPGTGKNRAFMNKKKKRYLNHLGISKVLRPKGIGVRMVYYICI